MFFRKIFIAILMINFLPASIDSSLTKYSQKYITYAYLAARIYDEGNTTVGKIGTIFNEKWKLVDYKTEKNGFQAGLYFNKEKEQYIVSYGGTTANPKELKLLDKIGGSLLDVGEDIRLLSNLYPSSQSESALKYIESVKNTYNIKIYAIVGHSLGGGLAAYAGLYYNIPTFTVNTAPIPLTKKSLDKFLKNHAIVIPKKLEWGKEFKVEFTHTDKITNLMSNYDKMTKLDFFLQKLDKEEFNPTNPATPLNTLKLAMLIPIQMRLNYIFVGKKIILNTDTGHSSVDLLDKMIEAKDIEDNKIFKQKWGYLTKKVLKLQKKGFKVTLDVIPKNKYTYDDAIIFDKNYPNKKAYINFVIDDMRELYNSAMDVYFKNNRDFIKYLGLSDKIDLPQDYIDVLNNKENNNDIYITYKEYMILAESIYKKVLGGRAFFSNLRKKYKSYIIFDKKFSKYADNDMKTIYGHIFILHFVSGTPKEYLKDDSQNVTNAFVTNFLDRFYKNIIKYRNKTEGK